MTLAFSAGNIISTTGDLFKWFRGLQQNQLISQKMLDQNVIIHSGATFGHMSRMIYFPDSKDLVLVLSNLRSPLTNDLSEVLSNELLKVNLNSKMASQADHDAVNKYVVNY